ncbi:MAG TPA: DUF86 domain-containing protein [Candidatus Hydrogenedentes bacterium]|nr:DUF86 domain-containing protein [Candidatus Hydrogenedentota bacterium]
MLDAARAIAAFAHGRCYNDYIADRMFRNAVERNLEVVGEAARCLSAGFRETHPEIPWRSIVAQRNVLAHDYGDIRHERVWAVCRSDLLDLIRVLEQMDIEPPQDTTASPE